MIHCPLHSRRSDEALAAPPVSGSARRATASARACAWVLGLVVWLTGGSCALAQRDLKDIPDPDPELERRSFVVADGFEVNLFAADPLLAKPIEMSFDADGRLWVACSEVYPQIKPGQQPDDKILVLDDKNGDGRADQTTVFAGGLLIPTGVEPGDGGAYVANSTELVFLKDTDGDGKADSRRVVLSGFGTEDTHHIVHTFRWGPDGRLYFNQSVYIHSHLETPRGVRRLAGGGIWQLRPETMQLDVFMRGSWNPWGHAWDDWGQSFVTDGAGTQGILYTFPGATFDPSPGANRFLPGLNPGSPKLCGLEIVSGRHLPDDWQGALLTNDFRAHRVCRYVVSEDGAGFAAREMPELIKTSHAAFRPIDVKQGPDGAIYIADWYNPIIQHGEVDFRDPRRDHTRGRIWRVAAKGRPLVERPKLSAASLPALLDQLKSPEGWTRKFAKRLLKRRGEEVLPVLGAWVIDLRRTDPGYEHNLLEALWTYQSLDVVDVALVEHLLHARDPRVRAAAIRVAGEWHTRLADPLAVLKPLVADEYPRVRLEAVRALGTLGTAGAAQAALEALDLPVDRFLDHALYLTARDLQSAWLPALERGEIDFGGDPRRLGFALAAADSPAVAGPLTQLVQGGKLPLDRRAGILELIASVGGPAELSLVFDEALSENFSPRVRAALLHRLAQTERQRKLHPTGDPARLAKLISAADDSPGGAALRLAALDAAGAWRVEGLRAQLLELSAALQTAADVRSAALLALAALGGNDSRAALTKLSSPGQTSATRAAAITALAGLDPQAAAARCAELMAEPGAEFDPREMLVAFAERKGGAEALTAALKNQKISPDAAKLAVRAVRDAALEQPELLAALTAAGSLAGGRREFSPAEIEQLLNDVAAEGNAARGEALFRRADQACFKCHAIGGAGGRVGPDLLSIGASAQVDYLLDSILHPSAKVKENYHSLVVATDDGHVYTGIKIRQTERELTLRDAEDREITIPLGSIEEQKGAGSLMPVGLADSLTRAELVDLVRFLSELGRVAPFVVDKARVVRRWELLTDTPSVRAALAKNADAVATSADLLWTPAYSKVSGDLPLVGQPAPAFVRFQLDVTTPGKVRLAISPAAARIWIDGQPKASAAELVLDLATGQHTIVLGVEPAAVGSKPEPTLRAELKDVPDSKAQVQIVGGK
jgi:putative heme-binding domain-containing protein